MISFASDYIAGAHPEVLRRLVETNLETTPGYGTDAYCAQAAEKIKAACACPAAEIFFLTGGTQTNQVAISTLLKPYEGVVAAQTGHVSLHEAGAIEYTGHKVLTVAGREGKMSAETLAEYLRGFYADENHEHMVFPGMVYISFPTEYGTLYSKAELTEISAVCRQYEIPLFIDGARMAYGLASYANDVTLADLAALSDVFYIGGTKCGTLCGEALVFAKQNMPKHFVGQVKQHGALLAKGRVIGLQFDALFTDDLYGRIGNHAIVMAEKLKEILDRKGYQLFLNSPTNQQFVIISNAKLAELSREIEISFWEQYDADHTVIRLATSWSTTEEDLAALEKVL